MSAGGAGQPEYPFDRDDFDPALRALLSLLRQRPLQPSLPAGPEADYAEGERRRLEALVPGMPPAVRALLHTTALHGFSIRLTAGHHGYELYGEETLHGHGFREEIEAALGAAGAAPNEVIYLGATGGGEDNLLLTWSDHGYALATWAIQEAELGWEGTFTDFVTAFARTMADEEAPPDPDDYAADLHALLVACGVWQAVEPEAAPAPPTQDGQPAWEPVPMPVGTSQWAPVALTEEEAPHFADESFYAKDLVRTSDGSVFGYSPAEVVVLRGGERHVVETSSLDRILPSPSGSCFLAFHEKGELLEYPLDGGPATRVEGELSGATRWGADYLVDDDTIVTTFTDYQGKTKTWLLALKRNPETGDFEEVDNLQIKGTGLATAGRFIVDDGTRKVTVHTVIEDQLVTLGALGRPHRAGWLRSFPADARQEVRLIVDDQAFRLVHLEGLLAGKAAKKPKKGTQLVRRLAAGPPPIVTDAAAFSRAMIGVYETVPTGIEPVFRTRSGFVGAHKANNPKYPGPQHAESHILVRPDGTARRDVDAERTYLAGHPTDDRALLWCGQRKRVLEEELNTGQTVEVAKGAASYLVVDGRDLLLVAGEGKRVEVYERAAATAGPGTRLGIYEGEISRYGGATATGFVIEAGDHVHHVRVRFGADGVAFEVSPSLVLPGARFAWSYPAGGAAGGRDCVVTVGAWFVID